MGRSSQTDFIHQQWNCPVQCGGIHKNVKNTDFLLKNQIKLCMIYVMRKEQLIWIESFGDFLLIF